MERMPCRSNFQLPWRPCLEVLQGSFKLRRRDSSTGSAPAAALLAALGVAAPLSAPCREPLPLPPPPLLALEDGPAPPKDQGTPSEAVAAAASASGNAADVAPLLVAPGAEDSQEVTPAEEEEETNQQLQLAASALAVSQAMDSKAEHQAAAAGRAWTRLSAPCCLQSQRRQLPRQE